MAEKRTIELEVKESGFKSLKAQLREAQADVAALSDKFGVTSKEATAAAKAAGILKDKIADAKDLTDAFNPDAKFNSLSRSIGGVLNGFQAYEGAMGLIGVESEDLQKTLLKVQSAMALSQGIQGALEAKDSFVQLGAVVKTAFTGMTAASKAFMVGGIGLLLTGIGLLIANWDNLTASSSKAAAEQKKYAEETKKSAEENKKATETIAEESTAFVGLIYQLKSTNENSKERKQLINEINAKYGTTLKNLSDETAFQAQLNLAVKDYISYQKAKYELSANEKQITENLKKQEIYQNKLVSAKLALNQAELAGASGSYQSTQKLREAAQDNIDKYTGTLKSLDDKLVMLGYNQLSLTNQTADKYVPVVEKSTKATEDNTDAIDKNAKKYEEVGSLKLLTQEEHIKTSLDLLKEQVDAEAIINKDARDKALAADKAAADAQIANAKAVAEQKAAIQMQGLDVALQGVQLIKGVFEQQKGIQKAAVIAESAIGIAKMIIANKLANVAALATPQAIATSGAAAVPVIALNNISTGIGIAANIAATGKALKTLGGGTAPTAPSTGGGGGGGGVTAPNFNIVGNSGINQLAELGGQPIQAYVVSGEVTSAQALDRNRIQNASF
jgi:hypothetical protein